MVYDALDRGFEIKRLVSFNYGQRHKKELEYAAHTADKLNLNHSVIDLWSSGFTEALVTDRAGSSLIDTNVDVPDGLYSDETMKATVVPNRNMVMISIAGAIAVAEEANVVLVGVHSGDHAIYPDCRPHFIEMVSHALTAANIGFGNFDPYGSVLAPYIGVTKAHIAKHALELGVPLHDTWSCYKGDQIHCGRCGTCVERLEAIDSALTSLNGRKGRHEDRTEYADHNYWKTVVNI